MLTSQTLLYAYIYTYIYIYIEIYYIVDSKILKIHRKIFSIFSLVNISIT